MPEITQVQIGSVTYDITDANAVHGGGDIPEFQSESVQIEEVG